MTARRRDRTPAGRGGGTERPRGRASRGQGRIAVLLLALALAACGGDDAADAPETPPRPVRTVVAESTTWAEPVRTSGTLASLAEMDLAFRVSGYIAELPVSEGFRVREGQVLARLRTDEVDAQVRSAAAQAELARKNLDRMERLFADSVVTGLQLDQARDADERAQAALEVARFSQAYAVIRAPADGRVLRTMAEVSEFAPAGSPVVRVASSASGWVVRTSVADRHVVRLALGDSADVTFEALGQTLPGTVTEIADAADPRSGTFGVEITVDAPDPRLRSGMVARVEIRPREGSELVFLPTHALVDADGRDAAVFVLDDGRAARRPVRVVSVGADAVGVEAPDLAGARVVTDGAAYLREGDPVEDRGPAGGGPSR